MPRALLHKVFNTAIEASHPLGLLANSPFLVRLRALQPKCPVRIIAAGKGAAAMAQALEEHWPFSTPPVGVAVAPEGYSVQTKWVETMTAAHPHPDDRSVAAAKKVASISAGLRPDDLLIVLLSGGGSSLLSWPVDGVSLKTYASLLRQLMAVGADIETLNAVRRHLSRLAGGKLAQLAKGAHIEALLLSDVVGDGASLITSGPVSPDATTLADTLGAIKRHGVGVSAEISAALADPRNETLKPDDPVFEKVSTQTIPSSVWIAPAAELLRAEGYDVRVIAEQIGGDAAELAHMHASVAIEAVRDGRPVALLSGGEATTRLRGDGEGGPNAEFCLELARALNGCSDVWALACDSDGIDGASNAAGGIVTPSILDRAAAIGCSVNDALSRSDSAGLLKALGDAVVVGPTMTNVNDMRVVLVNPT